MSGVLVRSRSSMGTQRDSPGRWRRVLALSLMAVIAATANAQAAPFGPAEETAWLEAETYWLRAPTGCATIDRETVPPGSLDWIEAGQVGISGRATQTTRGAPFKEDCVIRIVEGLDPLSLCFVVRHEYGHLLGYGHDDPELANLPPCVAPPPPPFDDSAIARRQAWQEWRETRSWCREARGPFRAKCWRQLRRERARLVALY